MAHNYTFKLTSECPIEVVYGVTADTLKAIKSENTDANGYDWIPILDDHAEQREEFLSGVDKDDAKLFVTDQFGDTLNFEFKFEGEIEEDEDQSNIIFFDEAEMEYTGAELNDEAIDYVILARTELKYRNWIFIGTIEDKFEKNKVKIKIKTRDSEIDIAQTIYLAYFSNFENAITSVYYDGMKIPFKVDFTSYPSTFLCLKKTPSGWKRDEDLEYFFENVE